MAMSASSWTPPVTLSPKLSIWSRAFIIGLAICNASKGFTFRRTLCWNNKRKYGLEYQGLSLLQYIETFPSWRSQTGYSKYWAKTVQSQMRTQKRTEQDFRCSFWASATSEYCNVTLFLSNFPNKHNVSTQWFQFINDTIKRPPSIQRPVFKVLK